jgi:hypothetical protein
MDARPKVEWLRTLGERYLPDGQHAEAFFEALARISELQDDRNFIAHAKRRRLPRLGTSNGNGPRACGPDMKIPADIFGQIRYCLYATH